MFTLRKSININTPGPNTVVSSLPGARLHLHKLHLFAHGDVTVKLLDGVTPINGDGGFAMTQGSQFHDYGPPVVLSHNFLIDLSDAVLVTGWVQYTTEGTGTPPED